MRIEEKRLFKVPFELSLRERVLKITNPPYNIKKGSIVKKANINHQTFLDFMNDRKDTKVRALSSLNDVISDYELDLNIKVS